MFGTSFFADNVSSSVSGGIDSFTKLMLHMDDAGLSDSSLTPKTMTLGGDTARSAVQSKFGGFSGAFNAGYLSTPASSDFVFTGDFTIDLQLFFTSHIAAANIITNWSLANDVAFMFQYSSANGGIRLFDDSGVYDCNFAWSPSDGQWYHVAIIRTGTTTRAFIDGVKIGADQTAVGSVGVSGSTVYIGQEVARNANSQLIGFIDELRVSKGIARWTSNFTPPSAPYTT